MLSPLYCPSQARQQEAFLPFDSKKAQQNSARGACSPAAALTALRSANERAMQVEAHWSSKSVQRLKQLVEEKE
jgi:hypothetical protein